VERHSPRDGSPFLGSADARDTLTFFIDYQCPVCPRAAREMPALVASFKGLLKVEIKHNPLEMHRQALDAAAAARAAQRQGRFWEYHDMLLDSRNYDRDTLVALADKAGLSREAFQRDFDDAGLRQGILDEMHEAVRAGAIGTPGFLINGHAEVGWASLSWLQAVVRRHIE
jgi:protein-disulfide isomerase